MVAPDLHDLAQAKAAGQVGDGLVVAAGDLAAGGELRRPARRPGAAGGDADDHGAHVNTRATWLGFSPADLHGQVGDIGRLRDARHGADAAPQVVGDARGLGVGAEGVALHHPQVGAAVVEQDPAVVDHAAIDAGHGQGDADEQAEPDAGEDELAPGVQDVAPGQADHGATPGRRSTTLIRLPAPSAFSL